MRTSDGVISRPRTGWQARPDQHRQERREYRGDPGHYNDDHNKRVKIGQCKYLNNIVEQDHRHVKRRCRAMLGFKHFDAAQKTLAGIELIRMLKKGQMRKTRGIPLSLAEQFYALAA